MSKETLHKQSAAATVVDNMSFEEDIDAVVLQETKKAMMLGVPEERRDRASSMHVQLQEMRQRDLEATHQLEMLTETEKSEYEERRRVLMDGED